MHISGKVDQIKSESDSIATISVIFLIFFNEMKMLMNLVF